MSTIIITPYQTTWPAEFRALGSALRAELGPLALRIDHIGSTAVPGLAAKDRIDIQITVQGLDRPVEDAILRAGYEKSQHISRDHVPPGWTAGRDDDWIKWVFAAPELQRPVNVHVRLVGRPNQRYPLLFRDYLRANPAAAEAYARVKKELAHYHPDDIAAYNDLKDPVCDIIMAGAEQWAQTYNWQPGPSDC